MYLIDLTGNLLWLLDPVRYLLFNQDSLLLFWYIEQGVVVLPLKRLFVLRILLVGGLHLLFICCCVLASNIQIVVLGSKLLNFRWLDQVRIISKFIFDICLLAWQCNLLCRLLRLLLSCWLNSSLLCIILFLSFLDWCWHISFWRRTFLLWLQRLSQVCVCINRSYFHYYQQ